MTYEKSGFTLFSREQPLRGEKVQTIYFFSKRAPAVGKPCDVPEGYIVALNHRTGVPYLKKK